MIEYKIELPEGVGFSEYTSTNSSQVYLMDCVAGMKQFTDNYFDLAVVDPPYGINAGKMTMGSGKHKFKKDKTWDESIPKDEYWSELFRVSKNQIVWGGELLHGFSTPDSSLAFVG